MLKKDQWKKQRWRSVVSMSFPNRILAKEETRRKGDAEEGMTDEPTGREGGGK